MGFPCVNTPNVESGTFVRPAIVGKGALSFIELKVRHAHPCTLGVGSRKVEFEFELDFRGRRDHVDNGSGALFFWRPLPLHIRPFRSTSSSSNSNSNSSCGAAGLRGCGSSGSSIGDTFGARFGDRRFTFTFARSV